MLKTLIIDTLDALDEDFLMLLRYRRVIVKLLEEKNEDSI